MGPLHQSSLQLENIEDIVYALAPSENITPKYVLMDDVFEVLKFY